jgi:peptidoglycan/xylan/chitin deacetylase (PgdA/CDA1 family)
MRIPGVKTAKNFSRWLQARFLGGALILGYHRITPTAGDVYEVCVSPENFAEHLDILRKYTRPISLSKLVGHLKEDSLPPNSVAVTFDDGYADNLYHAKPVLEKYEVPATIFVCTGYAGREFWWDELERLVRASQADLYALHLQVGKSLFQWDQPNGNPEAEDLQVRRQFRHALYHFLLALDIEDQNDAMHTIRNWSSLPADEISISRGMSHQELLQLVEGGLIELGAHTRHHPMLPRLSFERQKDEIDSSKRDLEELLGEHVAGFAYPNGKATDDAKRIVQEAGFAFACTSLHDVVRPGCDLHELTRFWQKDVNGDKFLQSLKLWTGTSGDYA